MPRPLTGRVGRSAGVAEHRVARHRSFIRLSRTTTFTRFAALGCVAALALAGAPSAVGAQTSSGSIAATRSAINATADQWFAAQRQSADLDLQIETLTNTLAQLQPKVDQLRQVADTRAVELYESNTQALGSVMGNDPLDIGRRAALIGQANANGQAVIDQLQSSIADLTAQRNQLRAAQSEQAKTLNEIAGRRQTLDAQLASLEEQSAAGSERVDAAAIIHHRAEPATTAEPTRPAIVALTSTPAPPADTGPAAPPDTGAVSPHHNDPFLVCTRASREQRRLLRRQPERLLRRVPVLTHHLERHRVARRSPRSRGSAAVTGVGVRPGRDGVGALPVAGHRPVGRALLTGRC